MKYYPFELHTHTVHSDGQMTPKMLIEKAYERGLRGIALTDHNTTSAINEVIKHAKKYNMLVIPAIEWTTFYGHLTVLGGNSNVDWRKINLNSIRSYIKQANEVGDIVNIAHPMRPAKPLCAGCKFEYDVDFDDITGIEVWSGNSPQMRLDSLKTIRLYDTMLARGNRLTALYGNDWHDKEGNSKQYAITYLGIQGELTAGNAVTAIKKGRAYISIGISAELNLLRNNCNYELGDTLETGEYTLEVKVELNKEYCNKYSISPKQVSVCGTGIGKEFIKELDTDLTVTIPLNLNDGYIRLEILGAINNEYGCILFTSPYYIAKE